MHVSQHYIIISVTTGSLVNSHTQLIKAFIRALECLHEDTIQFADRLRECEFHAPQRMANGLLGWYEEGKLGVLYNIVQETCFSGSGCGGGGVGGGWVVLVVVFFNYWAGQNPVDQPEPSDLWSP